MPRRAKTLRLKSVLSKSGNEFGWYFLRFDVAWQMNGVFQGKPQTYLALGLDF